VREFPTVDRLAKLRKKEGKESSEKKKKRRRKRRDSSLRVTRRPYFIMTLTIVAVDAKPGG